MDPRLTGMSRHDLLAELDSIERAIARSTTFHRWTDELGRSRVHVTEELLALAEREQEIVGELGRRVRASSVAA